MGKDILLKLERISTCHYQDNPELPSYIPGELRYVRSRGNEGIYVRIDEWKDTYGTNMYVIDEVTG